MLITKFKITKKILSYVNLFALHAPTIEINSVIKDENYLMVYKKLIHIIFL